MTLSILAIDPGNRTGWAMFHKRLQGWELSACGVVQPEERDWPAAKADLVIIENPVIYPRSPVPPNDLMVLARTVGRYEERFEQTAKRLVLVKPRQWKGSVHGDIMTQRILDAMRPVDRDTARIWLKDVAKSYQHNAVDAIGLGIWATKQRRFTEAS